MLPAHLRVLWTEYLTTEQVRIRQQSMEALACFTTALQQLPSEVWHPWAVDLIRRLEDCEEDIPVRMPLFQIVLFPVLRDGIKTSTPNCARQLAKFSQLLYKSPTCSEQLPENLRTEYGLILEATRIDPADHRAQRHLLELMRSHFDYALHELPCGVLYGMNCADSDQCAELLKELDDYEKLANQLGPLEIDVDLIAEARFHIPNYQQYLSNPGNCNSYEQYLAQQ